MTTIYQTNKIQNSKPSYFPLMNKQSKVAVQRIYEKLLFSWKKSKKATHRV